ncbi:site-specific integrase [Moritella dasanensis]|uniref:site-specific integrase n=1 Tax=Moritella dasanensis TaxID=428031 RepID=UPI0002FD231D|nr:site-specific integrase [Moritella dasanensis]
MSIPLPNISRRNQTYYFRQRIPCDLVQFLNKKEFYFSLQTTILNTAVSMVNELLLKTDNLFKELKNVVSKADLDKILYGSSTPTRNTANKPVDADEWIRATVTTSDGTSITVEADHNDPLEERESIRIATEQAIQQVSGYSSVKQATTNISVSLGSAIKQYLQSKQDGPEITTKSYETIKAKILLLSEYFDGGRDIATLKLKDAESFRNILLKLPPNRAKVKKYDGLSLQEIADFGDEPQSITTVKATLNKCSAFFNWCIKSDIVEKNYFEKLPLSRKTHKDSDERKIWYKNDLNTLFNADIWATGKCKHDYQFWLPLIALHTGARLTEIAQLRVEDIKDMCGIKCFHINEEHKFQKLKNPDSMRYIPIHSALVDLGFIDFVATKSSGWLFNGLLNKQGEVPRDGLGTKASKWFLHHKDKLGIEEPVFHSFRHTVANEFKQKSVPEQQAMGVLGHKSQSITYARYDKDLNVPLLQETIEQLDFNLYIKNVKAWGVV